MRAHLFACATKLFVLLMLLALLPGEGYAQWHEVKKDGCSSWGKRQYSARLHSNPQNDWRKSCEQSPISINGSSLRANRCDDYGWFGGMWGVWFVDDSSCAANWDTPKDDGCIKQDLRKYSAILRNIPDGDWVGACRKTSLTVGGKFFSTPTNCLDLGNRGMWGEFEVEDTSCRPRWSSWTEKGCFKENRIYYARLENTQTNNWEQECIDTPVVINGVNYGEASRCYDRAMWGLWGEMDVPDEVCKAQFDPERARRVEACKAGIDEDLTKSIYACEWGDSCTQAFIQIAWTLGCEMD